MPVNLGAEIKLRASERELRRDLSRARRTWRGFTNDVQRNAAQAARITATAATGMAVALTAATRAAATQASELYNLSRNAGVAAEEYQRFNRAFENLGGNDDTFLTLLNDLSDRIGDAANGAKNYQEELAAIGIDYRRLIGLSPVAQLEQVIDALSRMGDEATRDWVGNSLLGGEFEKIRGIIQNGGWQSVERMADAVARAGIITNAAVEDLKNLDFTLEEISRVTMAGFANSLSDTFGEVRLSEETLRQLHDGIRRIGNAMFDGLQAIYRYRDAIWLALKVLVAFKVAVIGVAVGQTIYAGLAALGTALVALTTNFRAVARQARIALTAVLAWFVVPALSAAVVVAGKQVYDAVKANFDNVKNIVDAYIDHAIARFDYMKTTIIYYYTILSNRVKEIFGDMIDTLAKGLKEFADFVLGFALLNPLLPQSTKEGIRDFRSKDVGTSGFNTEEAKQARLDAEVMAAVRMIDAFMATGDTFTDLVRSLASDGVNLFEALKSEFAELGEWGKGIYDDHVVPIIEHIKRLVEGSVPDLTLGDGESPLTGTGTGTTSGSKLSGEMVQRIRDATKAIVDGLKQSLDLAFRTGDFKPLARNLLATIQSAFSSALIDQFGDWLAAQLQVLFNRLAAKGNEGGALGTILSGFISALGGGDAGSQVPKSHTGSRVPGGPGSEHLRLVEGGQFILRPDQYDALLGIGKMNVGSGFGGNGGSMTVTINNNIQGDTLRQTREDMRDSAHAMRDILANIHRENGPRSPLGL